jgi:hypothetical protein
MDDTMTGIDSTNSKSIGKASKHKSNQKWYNADHVKAPR